MLLQAENEMINRLYTEGQKLDVAGLNEITVLIDRSETELTEVGWNCWAPNQDGPPHKHNDKSQIFYVTNGVGKIHLGKDIFDAKPGSLAYVPAGLVHQTITTTDERLCYILFNVFLNPQKEGHLTFADHIEKVKRIRKQQALSGKVEVDNEETNFEIRPAKFIEDINFFRKEENSDSPITLVDETDNRLDLKLVTHSPGAVVNSDILKNTEQTIFVLNGNASITIENETEEIKPGNILFIPSNIKYEMKISNDELIYLCLSALTN